MNTKKLSAIALACSALALSVTPAQAGIIALESGDAGQTTSTAQAVAVGTTDISGRISTVSDVDMYQISWLGGVFSANTYSPVGTLFDPQLFLFTSAGSLVVGNDDVGQSSQSAIVTTTLAAGNYFLAISTYNNDPYNALHQNMCLGGNCPPATANGPLAYWAQTATQPGTGTYNINMSVPEPGTLALLGIGLAGLGFSSRRKQQAG